MIYTSYFGNMKKIRKEHPEISLFSIAGKTPNWFLDFDKCFTYKALAPRYDWWAEWHNRFWKDPESEESKEFYTTRYLETVLSKLNPHGVSTELKRVGGDDICLLCYETKDKFCHRHLVSRWLKNNGIPSVEY